MHDTQGFLLVMQQGVSYLLANLAGVTNVTKNKAEEKVRENIHAVESIE